MTVGDRAMSPKIFYFGFCDVHRLSVLACIELRDSIVAAATLSIAPKQFQPRVPSPIINETANWNQTRVRFGGVVRLYSVVRQGMPTFVHCARQWVFVQGTGLSMKHLPNTNATFCIAILVPREPRTDIGTTAL